MNSIKFIAGWPAYIALLITPALMTLIFLIVTILHPSDVRGNPWIIFVFIACVFTMTYVSIRLINLSVEVFDDRIEITQFLLQRARVIKYVVKLSDVDFGLLSNRVDDKLEVEKITGKTSPLSVLFVAWNDDGRKATIVVNVSALDTLKLRASLEKTGKFNTRGMRGIPGI